MLEELQRANACAPPAQLAEELQRQVPKWNTDNNEAHCFQGSTCHSTHPAA